MWRVSAVPLSPAQINELLFTYERKYIEAVEADRNPGATRKARTEAWKSAAKAQDELGECIRTLLTENKRLASVLETVGKTNNRYRQDIRRLNDANRDLAELALNERAEFVKQFEGYKNGKVDER